MKRTISGTGLIVACYFWDYSTIIIMDFHCRTSNNGENKLLSSDTIRIYLKSQIVEAL